MKAKTDIHGCGGRRTVRRLAEAQLPTEFGPFRIIGYRSLTSPEEFKVE